MLQMMDGGRTPAHWEARNSRRRKGFVPTYCRAAESIQIALINNMPDPALEDTESQFFELLDAAAGDLSVRIKLYSLPGIARGDRGSLHLNSFYYDFKDLWNTRFDAMIVTGTEPHHADLRNEPYWRVLVDVFEWAERNTTSTVLSCLAAHAAVLQGDGIERQALNDKQFGVFDEVKACDHELTANAPALMRFPHSRWNEVQENSLTESGYTLLTKSANAGVNLFVKKRKRSLFVHFQGHPEYKAETLLKEYCRDIKRFLRGETKGFPLMPRDYFDVETTRVLTEFQRRTLSEPRESLVSQFPDIPWKDRRESPWQLSAVKVYRNWLHYLASKKARDITFPVRRAHAGLA